MCPYEALSLSHWLPPSFVLRSALKPLMRLLFIPRWRRTESISCESNLKPMPTSWGDLSMKLNLSIYPVDAVSSCRVYVMLS